MKQAMWPAFSGSFDCLCEKMALVNENGGGF
jgi:hypothetical protein